MCTACLPTVCVLVATTRCQYQIRAGVGVGYLGRGLVSQVPWYNHTPPLDIDCPHPQTYPPQGNTPPLLVTPGDHHWKHFHPLLVTPGGQHWKHTHPLPCGQNDWQTPVKTLLSLNFIGGGNQHKLAVEDEEHDTRKSITNLLFWRNSNQIWLCATCNI